MAPAPGPRRSVDKVPRFRIVHLNGGRQLIAQGLNPLSLWDVPPRRPWSWWLCGGGLLLLAGWLFFPWNRSVKRDSPHTDLSILPISTGAVGCVLLMTLLWDIS